MPLSQFILSHRMDAAPAVFYKNTVLTYGALRQAVELMADSLLTCGHQKGDRIGIWSENSPFFVIAYLGTIRAGLVAVPFQTDGSPDTFEKIVADAGIKSLFVSQRFHSRLRPWAEKSGVTLLTEPFTGSKHAPRVHSDTPSESHSANAQPDISAFNFQLSTSPSSQSAVVSEPPSASNISESQRFSVSAFDPARALAALLFTSGSTGSPKGVMVTHQNIESNTRDIISYLGLGPQDRAMLVLPLHYCYGLSLLHTLLAAGGSLVLNNDFKLYPETVLQEMLQKECTGFAGVPSTYQLLLRKSRFRQLQFPKLRWFQQAGGKLHNPFIKEIRDAFPHVSYYLMYGQTEATARLSYLPPDRLADKLGSIGRGLPSTRLEVLKPDGLPVVAGSDEIGEIVASGPNVTLGYWNDPAETEKYFRAGKLYTGDLAKVDAEGFIFIVERDREMIKSGGNRVSAKEVEDVIAELPDVVEVAVIGVSHDLLGEAIRAFVVVGKSVAITPESVQAHCRKRLPSFKVPESVVFLKNMPHNSAGKILKPKLRELVVSGGHTPQSVVP